MLHNSAMLIILSV